MKSKKLPLFLYLFSFMMFLSCGRDGNGSTGDTSTPFVENLKVTFKVTSDIYPTWVTFKGSIIQNTASTSSPGFVYSTSPNPEVNSGTAVSNFVSGNADFQLYSGNLQPNTTYYVRCFVKKSDGTYIYSSENTFKTTGYYGPAGGYVAYDKGEITNGWRYMEVHPTTINYSTGGIGGQWGDTGTFISGTYPDFGKGFENTAIIVAGNAGANCAAKLCKNLVRNGFSDWFLPSSQELFTMAKELKKANISLAGGNAIWTSSQVNANEAYMVNYQATPTPDIVLTTNTKGMGQLILPVRRY